MVAVPPTLEAPVTEKRKIPRASLCCAPFDSAHALGDRRLILPKEPQYDKASRRRESRQKKSVLLPEGAIEGFKWFE